MKAKMKIKFDLNETIRRLEEISKGYQESAKRMEKLIEKLDEIQTLKTDVQPVNNQQEINAKNSLQNS